MKKILSLLIISVIAMPAFGACSIDSNKPCTASVLEDNQSLQQKYTPNPLEKITRTDAFQPKYRKPYYNELINTGQDSETSDYNSNCQFGVCLPSVGPTEGDIVE